MIEIMYVLSNADGIPQCILFLLKDEVWVQGWN